MFGVAPRTAGTVKPIGLVGLQHGARTGQGLAAAHQLTADAFEGAPATGGCGGCFFGSVIVGHGWGLVTGSGRTDGFHQVAKTRRNRADAGRSGWEM